MSSAEYSNVIILAWCNALPSSALCDADTPFITLSALRCQWLRASHICLSLPSQVKALCLQYFQNPIGLRKVAEIEENIYSLLRYSLILHFPYIDHFFTSSCFQMNEFFALSRFKMYFVSKYCFMVMFTNFSSTWDCRLNRRERWIESVAETMILLIFSWTEWIPFKFGG